MATTALLSVASTEAASSDVSVADGSTVTLVFRGQGSARIQIKDADGTYQEGPRIGTDGEQRSGQVSGEIVFRVFRPAQSTACGVDLISA